MPERAKPQPVGRHAMSRSHSRRVRQAQRRRRRIAGLSVAALVVVAVATVFLGSRLWHALSGPVGDYTGDGKNDVVVQVHAGDTTTAIAETLQRQGVVATVKVFVDAAHGNAAIAAIQPGFYRVRTEIPGAAAVAWLADPNNRVGRLVIPEGRQLDDTTDMKTNAVTEGIFTLIGQSSCVELDGERRCVKADDLRRAAGTAPLEELSVPGWATQQVAAMGDDHRRLEGLIAPGTWNVDPSAAPAAILGALITQSSASYADGHLQDTATALDMTPYEVLVVASLVQREAQPPDFDKVARVIYNRLAAHRSLEFDSTVNYPLDRREVATSDADRAHHTPWNTYLLHGLPATPIGSPGSEALNAAEHPAPGGWLYFVTIDQQGTTLFTRDYQQHLANIELAKRNGVLDSTR